MNDVIELLVYAAALDLYRRSNRGEVRLGWGKVSAAMLAVVDWEARPACLDSMPYDGRSNEDRNADDAYYAALAGA